MNMETLEEIRARVEARDDAYAKVPQGNLLSMIVGEHPDAIEFKQLEHHLQHHACADIRALLDALDERDTRIAELEAALNVISEAPQHLPDPITDNERGYRRAQRDAASIAKRAIGS